VKTFALENDVLRLTFSHRTGALVGLNAVATDWAILDREHLGLSFRLLVPQRDTGDWNAKGRRNNVVHGEKQSLTSLTVTKDKREATLVWDSVMSDHNGVLPITVKLVVTLSATQAVFVLTVENRSQYVIENVYCPYLGDVQHPEDEEWFEAFSYHYASAQQWAMWPNYQSLRGYWGVDHPTQFAPANQSCGAPMAPYILLRGAKQGLYVGVRTSATEVVAWHTELRQGYGSSIDSRIGEELIIGGREVATRFAAVHVPYIQPGETRDLTPIALEPFQGTWHRGVDIYKKWRSSWMKPPTVPSWAREPHAWQQIHINSPEDELRISFRDLPKIGEDCRRHSVKAIQLVGWNHGGQDQGNPSHDPDPRLGTFEELKDAIAKIHAMGVMVVLFTKFTWADRATERFREDLIRLAIKDPYGDHHVFGGYQYQTATQLLDINTKRLVPMCFLSEEYLNVCTEEFKKILELGAAGILVDESQHHEPALLCFDSTHGHRHAAPVYANDRLLIRRFQQLSQPVNSQFLYAGEGCYDWEMDVYHLSYHRSQSKEHIPLSRYMLPEGFFMTAVTGFNDRSMINQCLLYRYVISYEPYNYKGRLDDYPLTTEYGRKMDALRTELREYFWDGEFRDKMDVRVTSNGNLHHPYSVFSNRTNGKVGVAVANYDEKNTVTVTIECGNATVVERYRLVDMPEWRSVRDGIKIPPSSAVVVIE
jgi:hypothetical protein